MPHRLDRTRDGGRADDASCAKVYNAVFCGERCGAILACERDDGSKRPKAPSLRHSTLRHHLEGWVGHSGRLDTIGQLGNAHYCAASQRRTLLALWDSVTAPYP